MDYKEGDKVDFVLPNITGTGTIKGKALQPQAAVGAAYIVEPQESLPGYDYTHILVFESQLRAFNKEEEENFTP